MNFKSIILLTLLCIVGIAPLSAQSTGEFRTTALATNWSVIASWETFNGSMWLPATAAPTSTTPLASVNHNLSVNTAVSNPNTVVGSGITLTVSTLGVLTMPPAKVISGAGNFTLALAVL